MLRFYSHKLTRAQSVALCGLSVALLAVSAWISIPLGPIPFTLQTFVLIIFVLAYPPRECLLSIGAYLLIGTIGLPVFSGMRGGLALIFGPTGGFLWGFLLAAALVVRARVLLPGQLNYSQQLGVWIVSALLFLAIVYACGWLQLSLVAHLSFEKAFYAAVAPFVLIDLIKAGCAVALLCTFPRKALQPTRGEEH